MSNENNSDFPGENGGQDIDELSLLKQRARMLGVNFSNNIGLDALKERVRAKMEGEEAAATASADEVQANPLIGQEAGAKRKTLRQHLIDENMKLVRIRITCLDPKKKDLPGEVITVANEHLGTVRKFIPYGEHTDGGYNVPYCLYRMLERRRFQSIRIVRDRVTKRDKVETSMAREFSIEVLPQLTAAELRQLATAQMAANSVESVN